MESIKERQEKFRATLKEWCDDKDPDCEDFPVWLRIEFWEHWTGMNDNGKKMFFEMQKTWYTGGRLRTFKNNSLSWHPSKWKNAPKKDNVYHQSERMKPGQMIPKYDGR